MAVYQVQLILLTLTSAPKPPSNRYSYHRLPAWSISTTRSKQICNFIQCYSTFIDCMFKIFIFQLHELFRILYGMFSMRNGIVTVSTAQGQRSYFESGGADKWLKVVWLKKLFLATLYNFQKRGRVIAPPAPPSRRFLLRTA